MTGNDLIASSLRLIGALASGEVPSGAEASNALDILNQMIDSWNAERLTIFSIQRNVQVPAALKQTYTLGTGGDFNIARPPKLERMGVIILSNPVQPLELPMEKLSDIGWQSIPVKGIVSTIPLKFWNDNAFPLMNINVWPIPSAQINFTLYVWQALTQFPDLVTDETFPPGYLKALRYNLAVDLAPEFGRTTPQEVLMQAVATKAVIKSINASELNIQSAVDPALVGRGNMRVYDWRTDRSSGSGY